MPSQNTESFTVGELVVPEPGRDHLALWLKADAGVQQDGTNNVIGWSDQSGNSNHAGIPAAPPKQPAPKRGAKLDLPKPTAPQLAAQAINGKPAIRFTGDPGLEIVPRSGWPTKDTTVFAVVRCPRKTGNGAILGGITKGASPFQISMPAMTGDIGWNYGLNMVVLDFTNDEMPKLLECSTVDGAARIIHVDGGGHEVLFKERKPAASPPVTDDLKFLLGNSLEGDLAELLVYDRPLATAERHRVGFYLSQKYGIPSRYSAASAQVVGLLDLKRRQSIDGITVEFASGGRPAETPPCTVEVSADGRSWKIVADKRLDETVGPLLCRFDPVDARYARILTELKGNQKWPVLSAFRACSKDSSAPLPVQKRPLSVWPDECPVPGEPAYNLLPDTYAWIMAHNRRQVITTNFLETALSATEILLPNGQVEPLWKVRQFFDFNFRIFHFGCGNFGGPGGQEIVTELSNRYRKIMARPAFLDYVMTHPLGYSPRPLPGTVGFDRAMGVYNRHRKARKNLPMSSYSMGAAGMSNGGNVCLATWVDFCLGAWPFSIMSHETGHCLGFNDGTQYTYGLQDYMGGKFGAREWSYREVDLNSIALVETPPRNTPRLPSVSLAGLEPVGALSNSVFRKDNCVTGSPLLLNGVTFPSGIGLLSNTSVVYAIPEGATRFVAVAGIDDCVREEGRAAANTLAGCILEVYGIVGGTNDQERLIARSPRLAGNSRQWWPFDVKLAPDLKKIRLIVRNTVNNTVTKQGPMQGRRRTVIKELVGFPIDWCNAGFAYGPWTTGEQDEMTVAKADSPASFYPGTKWVMEETVARDGKGPSRRQFAYWPDGTKRWETECLPDGTWNGCHNQWFSSGTKQLEENYVNGVLHGARLEWDATGKKISESNYSAGKLDGKVLRWLSDGTPAEQNVYKDGKPDGLCIRYYPDGKKWQEAFYVAGSQEGEAKTWSATGQLQLVQQFKDDKLNGKAVWYHKNGTPSKEAYYQQDLFDGPYKEWYDTGKLYVERTYKANRQDGPARVWHTNGQLAEESVHTNGLFNGRHVKYFPDGKKQLEETFVRNQLQGARTFWHANGAKYIEEQYKDNRLIGKRLTWHANGQLSEDASYEAGLKEGASLTWHANGKPQLEEHYKKGRRDGRCRQWDAKGNLVSDKEFKDGKPN